MSLPVDNSRGRVLMTSWLGRPLLVACCCWLHWPAVSAAEEAVRFATQAAVVGDRTEQHLQFDMDVRSSIVQGDQLVQDQRQRVRKTKLRKLIVEQVEGELPTTAPRCLRSIEYAGGNCAGWPTDAGRSGRRSRIPSITKSGRTADITRGWSRAELCGDRISSA